MGTDATAAHSGVFVMKDAQGLSALHPALSSETSNQHIEQFINGYKFKTDSGTYISFANGILTSHGATTSAFAADRVSGNVGYSWKQNGITRAIMYTGITGNIMFDTYNSSSTNTGNALTIANSTQQVTLPVAPRLSSFTTAGIVNNNSSGVLSTSTALPSGTTATT